MFMTASKNNRRGFAIETKEWRARISPSSVIKQLLSIPGQHVCILKKKGTENPLRILAHTMPSLRYRLSVIPLRLLAHYSTLEFSVFKINTIQFLQTRISNMSRGKVFEESYLFVLQTLPWS